MKITESEKSTVTFILWPWLYLECLPSPRCQHSAGWAGVVVPVYAWIIWSIFPCLQLPSPCNVLPSHQPTSRWINLYQHSMAYFIKTSYFYVLIHTEPIDNIFIRLLSVCCPLIQMSNQHIRTHNNRSMTSIMERRLSCCWW